MRRSGGTVSIVALAGAFFLLSGPRLQPEVPDAEVPDAALAAAQDICGELSQVL